MSVITQRIAKTNGQKRNLNGVEAYVVEYSANVLILRGSSRSVLVKRPDSTTTNNASLPKAKGT